MIDDSLSALASLMLIGLILAPMLIKDWSEKRYQERLNRKLYKMCHPNARMR